MRKTKMRTFVSTEIGRVRVSGLPSDSMITLYRGRDMHLGEEEEEEEEEEV